MFVGLVAQKQKVILINQQQIQINMNKPVAFLKELQAQSTRQQTSRMAYIYELGVDKYDFNTLNRLSYIVKFMQYSKFKDELQDEILQRRVAISRENFRKESSSVIVNEKIEEPSQQSRLPSMAEVKIRMMKMGYSFDPKQNRSTYERVLSRCKRNLTKFIQGVKSYVCCTKKSSETRLEQQKEERERLNKKPS